MKDNLVYQDAINLAQKLLAATTPTGKIPAIIILPCHKIKQSSEDSICFKSPQTPYFLASVGVIRIINTIKKTGESHKDWEHKVSFNRGKAEDFLYVIHHGDFALDRRDGTWTYKDSSKAFKLGTAQYKLIDMFMGNPYQAISTQIIIDTYGAKSRDAVPKRVVNDLIKEIKEPLEIPKEHFVPIDDGYIFKP